MQKVSAVTDISWAQGASLMNNRFWLELLLIALSLLTSSPTATAQNQTYLQVSGSLLQYPFMQSHHDLPGGLDLDNPQEMMAQRLQELRELHQLQDQVQGLLADREFLKNLQQLSETELRQLRDKMLRGEGLGKDQRWEELLKQAASHKKLEQQQIDILRRWAERAEHHQPPPPSEHSLLNNRSPGTPPPATNPNGSSSPAPSFPTMDASEPSLFDRLQEETTKWLMENLDDVGGDILDALVELGVNEEGTPLSELLRSMQQPDLSGMNVSDQAMGLSRYLPKVGEFLHEQRGAWDEVRSIFREAPIPSLPSIGDPSVSVPASAAAADSWVPALLSLLLLGMIVLLLYKMAARSQARAGSGDAQLWRLGPWPVPPGAVSTRQDVIRAFEYMALLCLGPAAAVCHHRELAERLAEQDSGNPARRQAAEILAWLYEQARYAPAGELLSPEELTGARHALCLLAGVTAL
jgi:hypothetical protein